MLVLLLFVGTFVFAQEIEEKVIIINSSNGSDIGQTVQVETVEGENGEIVIKMNGEEIKIDPAEYVGDDKRNYSVTIIKDGEKHEWQGEGDIPEEIENEIKIIKLNEEDVKVHEHKIYSMTEEDHDDRPVMGVQIENAGGNGAMVTDIFKGSGAEKAGLKKGDLIYKVGKKKVGNIDQLISALSNYDAGDKVKVRFLRGGDKKKKKVELGFIEKQVKKVECRAQPHKTSNIHYITKQKKVVTENPPMERPAVNVYELNINYNNSSKNLEVDMVGDAKPTTLRILDAKGNVLQEANLNSSDGRIMQIFTLDEEQKNGAVLEIIQDGKTIRENL